MEATEQQKLIINYEDGSAVITAAPGSGKTYVLAQKIKKNLKQLNEYQGVIAISYTNKASLELKTRSLSNGENPKSSFFGTIDRFYLSEIIIPFGKQLFGLPVKGISILKKDSLPQEEQKNIQWFVRDLKLDSISIEQIKILQKYYLNGVIIIESIGLLANYIFIKSLACRKYIAARYKYIYIDEYQDAGHEQHQLFLMIKELGLHAIAVGDLNQSIYGFSGKSPHYLNELKNKTDFKKFILNKNHRCHQSIINYSNYLLDPNVKLAEIDQKHIFYKWIEGDERNIAEWIDSKIESLQKFYKIQRKNQIAILTRKNHSAQLINEHLKTSHKFLDNNLLDINLNIWSSIFSNLLSFCYDANFKFIDVIEVFTSYEKLKDREIKELYTLKTEIETLIIEDKLHIPSISEKFKRIAMIIAPNSYNDEPIQLLEDILQNPIKLNSYIPANENEVNILTIHKSKGLEYDFVFHLDLHEWVMPHKDIRNGKASYSNWIEDLNLHYVAITRARKGCILVSSSQRHRTDGELRNGSMSEFLSYNNIDTLRYKN